MLGSCARIPILHCCLTVQGGAGETTMLGIKLQTAAGAAAVLSAVDGHELAEAVSRAVQVSRSVAAAAPATLQRVAPLVSALRCGADIRNMWQDTLARRMLRGRIISIERERRAIHAVDPDGLRAGGHDLAEGQVKHF